MKFHGILSLRTYIPRIYTLLNIVPCARPEELDFLIVLNIDKDAQFEKKKNISRSEITRDTCADNEME